MHKYRFRIEKADHFATSDPDPRRVYTFEHSPNQPVFVATTRAFVEELQGAAKYYCTADAVVACITVQWPTTRVLA
jgi:hypothetical protein